MILMSLKVLFRYLSSVNSFSFVNIYLVMGNLKALNDLNLNTPFLLDPIFKTYLFFHVMCSAHPELKSG